MYETYHFKIERQDIQYSYNSSPDIFKGIKNRKIHNEYCNMVVHASVVHPKKVKGRKVEINLRGSRSVQKELETDARDRSTVNWIGAIDLYRGSKIVYLTVPDDKVFDLYRLISSCAFKDIITYGTPLKYNKARFRSVNFIQTWMLKSIIEVAFLSVMLKSLNLSNLFPADRYIFFC